MTKYNYYEAVREDIRNYIENEVNFEDYESVEEMAEKLNDELWTEDSVTGNASGSYTFNTYEAEQNLCGNWGLIEEAAEALGFEPTVSDGWEHGAEWWDVTIRCYILGEVLAEVCEDYEEKFERGEDVE